MGGPGPLAAPSWPREPTEQDEWLARAEPEGPWVSALRTALRRERLGRGGAGEPTPVGEAIVCPQLQASVRWCHGEHRSMRPG
jgi:hypothetical protein